MKGSHRKCEEAPKKYDEKRRASSSFGMLNGANAAYGKVIWKAPPLKRFKGGTVILCGDKGMDAPHLVRLCGALCGGALSGTTSSLRSSCRLRRGEPTTKDTLCGVCALSGATSPLGGSCRRKRRGEPTSENNISFSPALSFGCGSPPTKVQRKKRCKNASHFSWCTFRDYFVAALLVPPSAGRTDIRE